MAQRAGVFGAEMLDRSPRRVWALVRRSVIDHAVEVSALLPTLPERLTAFGGGEQFFR